MCDRRLDAFTRAPVCVCCLDSIHPADSSLVCRRCGQQEDRSAPDAQGCSRCRGSISPFDRVGSFGIYDGNLRRLIHLLKYEKMLPLAWPLASKMLPELAHFGPIDLIVPVPLHWMRQWRRGFNQSAVLAERLAGHSQVAFGPRALRRVRRTAVQAGLSDSERLENVRGAFDAPSNSLKGRRVLLVDDVLTTGATMAAAGAAVKAAGAAYVGALTLARAVRQSSWDAYR